LATHLLVGRALSRVSTAEPGLCIRRAATKCGERRHAFDGQCVRSNERSSTARRARRCQPGEPRRMREPEQGEPGAIGAHQTARVEHEQHACDVGNAKARGTRQETTVGRTIELGELVQGAQDAPRERFERSCLHVASLAEQLNRRQVMRTFSLKPVDQRGSPPLGATYFNRKPHVARGGRWPMGTL
jgi:hypothetical protein